MVEPRGKSVEGSEFVQIELSTRVDESFELRNLVDCHDFMLEDDGTLRTRVKILAEIGLPVIGGFFIGFLCSFVNMMYAGHYGYQEGNSIIFAGVSLANLFSALTFYSLMVGMSSAVETLTSQYFGAQDYIQTGFILQRAIVILGTISLPLGVSWFFAGHLFAYFGVEPSVVRVVQSYLNIRAIGIPFDIFNLCYEKYLTALGVTGPPLYANIVQILSLVVLNCIFVYGLDLSFEWLAFSLVFCELIGAIVMIGLSWSISSVEITLQPVSSQALVGWCSFVSLGVPGVLMICSEWWAHEILTFFASRLGTASVAAQSIMLQMLSMAFMIPLGFAIATSTVVGNAMGAGKTRYAIEMSRLALMITFIGEVLVALLFYFGGSAFIEYFTNDEDVKDVFYQMLPFLSCYLVVDGMKELLSGILRGTGNQAAGAIANIFAYYVIGLPLAWKFCYHYKMGVPGLFYGLSVGTLFQITLLFVLVFVFESYIFRSLVSTQKK